MALAAGVLPIALNAGASLGAEQIRLTYGAVERTISVESLATYAREGEMSADLRAYIRYINQPQLQNLRQVLNARADFSPVAVSQFLYSDQGEILLRQLGEVIRTDANLSGFYALRSALILAAADPDGLTLLNVLKEFPLKSVRIDLGHTLQLTRNLESLIQQTQDAVALVTEQSALESYLTSWISFKTMPDLRQPGTLTWQLRTIMLHDVQRDRSFPADIYLPQTQEEEPLKAAPLVVISHGLGSDRSTYAYLAKHLASYGFVVAVPEHPGSNAQQLQDLISGRASQVTEPYEFVNRPLDIQYLLDELDYLTHTDPTLRGRIDLEKVGVLGQSMGAYTGLALAGAQINTQQLNQDCTTNTLNLSLLLQCRALNLPHSIPTLRDDRIKAVVAINPIGSSLLGEAGYASLRTPVMIVSSSADTIAPALPEQIRPFTWLQTPNRYLLLLQGGTHFSSIDVPDPEGSARGELVQLPAQLVGPNPAIAHRYLKGLSLSFFATYVAANPNYQPYLEASYATHISQTAMPARLVRSLTPMQLVKAIDEQVIETAFPGSNALSQREE
jgi:predicted dienelactone hydrolase